MRKGPINKAVFTSVNVTNSGILVLPENPYRFYTLLTNGSNQDMWIMLGVQNIFGEGIFIPKNGFSYEIDANNMWRGEIYGIISVAGPKTLSVFEGS